MQIQRALNVYVEQLKSLWSDIERLFYVLVHNKR
jgi:hypothetical protein